MKLTIKDCDNAKPKQKSYRLSDGGGLYLEIMPNGSKYWRLKYRFMGKEKRLALGVYPKVSLKPARKKREEAKDLLAQNKDPSTEKKLEKLVAQVNASNTFEAVALEWYDVKKDEWGKSHQQKTLRRLEMHAFPFIGKRPIANITPPELLECLRRVEKAGTLDMAGRVKQVCGQVFRYGIQTGKCERDPSNDLRGVLKTHQVEHFRTIDEKQIPDLLRAIDTNNRLYDRTRRAAKLSLLTFGRPGEIRQACWSHIDFEDRLWKIPIKQYEIKEIAYCSTIQAVPRNIARPAIGNGSYKYRLCFPQTDQSKRAYERWNGQQSHCARGIWCRYGCPWCSRISQNDY